MKNRLNTIGLGALIGSALIAMSSLGYTMAVANQPMPVEESTNAPSIVSVIDQYDFITGYLFTDLETEQCTERMLSAQESGSQSRRS